MGFLVLVKSVNWEPESYAQYSDFVAFPFFALFFPAVRFFLGRFVFQKPARRLIFGKGMQVVKNESQQQKKEVNKFKESAWKCIYYLSAEILALAVKHDEPWFKNTKYFWLGPGNQTRPDQKYK